MSEGLRGWVVVTAVAVAVATFLVRASYRWLKDPSIHRRPFALEGDEGDVMTHLVLIDLIRTNRHRIPRETPQFVLAGELDYPAAFHKLFSYIPRVMLERLEWLVSPFFEGIHAALVWLAAWWILRQSMGSNTATGVAMLVAAGFVLTPLLTYNPRRGSVLGERCFGFIFGHAFLFGLVLYAVTRDVTWLVGAWAAFAVAAASSKFAVQAMVFIGFIFAAIMRDPMSVAVLAGAVPFAVVMSGGYVWRVLKGTVRHSQFYRTFLVHRHDATRFFSTQDILDGFRYLALGRLRTARDAFKRHPIHRLPTLVPWLLPFICVAWWGPAAGAPESAMLSAFEAWAWAALAVTLLTATDQLKFLGEAERYMEYALFPMIMAVILAPAPLGLALGGALLLFCISHLRATYRTSGPVNLSTTETVSVVRWFQAQSPRTLFTVPGRLCFPLCYRTHHRAVWWFLNAPREPVLSRWKTLFAGGGVYPYLDPAMVASAYAVYGADTIVLDKRGAASAARRWGLDYTIKGYTIQFENDGYLVLDARPSGLAETSVAHEPGHGGLSAVEWSLPTPSTGLLRGLVKETGA